jgi:hypothetical protein
LNINRVNPQVLLLTFFILLKNLKHITCFSLLLFWGVHDVRSQVLNIQLEVEPEVETLVDQSLDFGQLIAGTGYQEIPLGSPNMGVFQVRALNAQRLILSLDSTDELLHAELGQFATIPVDLRASYTNNGVDDYRASTAMGSFFETIVLEAPPQNPDAVWSRIYVYVYGGINLGLVPPGIYRGEIVLTVIYE